MTFGDFEPEDAWHPDDPADVQVRNLVRRIRQLIVDALIPEGDPNVTLDAIEFELNQLRRSRQLTQWEQVRAVLIDDDVHHVRGRL